MKSLISILLLCCLHFGCTESENIFGCGKPEPEPTATVEITPKEEGIRVSIDTRFGDPITKTVTLAWDANSETDLAGYNLYYGISARPVTEEGPETTTYTEKVAINDATATTHSIDLTLEIYYFALTAFDDVGNESGFSNEVSANLMDAPTGFEVVGFVWDTYSSPESIDGFKLYYGEVSRGDIVSPHEPHPYTEVITTPGAMLSSFTTHIPVGDYYFTLTAYQGDKDTPFSNEVFASIAGEPIIQFPQPPEAPILTPII